MNAKDIKTELIRPRHTYISPNPERTVHTFIQGISPPEIIPYHKKSKIACVTTTFMNVLIFLTFAQQESRLYLIPHKVALIGSLV
jgi:hypothetical protein